MNKPQFYISAYASSPQADLWDGELESLYFKALAAYPEVIGIEHPFRIKSEKYSLQWLKNNVPNHWSIILTTIPTFLELAAQNRFVGLAATNEADRKEAVEIMRALSAYIVNVNSEFGRKVIKAVHFHAAPPSTEIALRANKAALVKSLHEVKQMNWGDVELNLEHCDALIPGQKPDKGFMSLQDEIEALTIVGGFGVVLNWARSVIEGRSVDHALKHVDLAQTADLLKGYFFSGCTDNSNSVYSAWKDSHMPTKKVIASEFLDDDSMLGEAEIAAVCKRLNKAVYLGVKVQNMQKPKTVERGVGLSIDTMRAIKKLC